MLCYLFRFCQICYIIQFFKGYKLLSSKGVAVESKLNLHFHVFLVRYKVIIIGNVLTINEQLCIFCLNHLPTGQLIVRTNFQSL